MTRGAGPTPRSGRGSVADRRRSAAAGGSWTEVARSAGPDRQEPGRGVQQKGLPGELTKLRAILARGLEAAESEWPEVRVAFGWVHRAAAILRNRKGLDSAGVRRRFVGLMGAVARHREAAGGLGDAIGHFLKVTRSYWPGLFACYDTAGLPRTNNGLDYLATVKLTMIKRHLRKLAPIAALLDKA